MRQDERLTLVALLDDPMTRLVMESDGVSVHEVRSLMLRVQGVLAARSASRSMGGVPERAR